MEFVSVGGPQAKSRLKQWLEAFLQLLPRRLYRWILFVRAHRRIPRQRPPRTFSEKVNWRIVHDRRAWVCLACDKLATKHDVSQRFDWIKVPPTLWVGTDLAELMAIELPDRWVLKPNHAAAMVCFGQGSPDAMGVEGLKAATSEWLSVDLGRAKGEVAHDSAARTFLVEPFLGEDPDPPRDFKGFVFDGRIAFWRVSLDRFGDHAIPFIDPGGNLMDMGLRRYPMEGVVPEGMAPSPQQLAEMNEIAETLGRGLDFVRVDLYLVDGEVVFGELTPFPDSGLEPYEPRGADRWIGDLWNFPTLEQVS